MSRDKPKRYWMNIEELASVTEVSAFAKGEITEPDEYGKSQVNRRDFLKGAGFIFATAALTGCSRSPVQKAIPYLVQPEGIVPGRAYLYTSSCRACHAGCGLSVKNRDGRPIKLEGNPSHPLSRGGLCAIGQASLLGLYDSHRLKQPLARGKPADWEEVDRSVAAQLKILRQDGRPVRFLSGTITSPTLRTTIEAFLKDFRDSRLVMYDPLSSYAILEAHKLTHGVPILPRFRFERAEVIVSFDADFLGTWISPVEFTHGSCEGRRLDTQRPTLSYHVQFESRMSLTGSKADKRVRTAPGEIGSLITQLAAGIAERAQVSFNAPLPKQPLTEDGFLNKLADRLWQTRGRSLVVCGLQDVQAQTLTNFMNHLLANYGSTLDLEQPSRQRQGDDRELEALIRELDAGTVAALFIHGVNPIYELPNSERLEAALGRVPLLVSFAQHSDETARLAQFVCPDHHYLESWGDAESVSGTISVQQPAIHPIGNSRSVLESLTLWSGSPKISYDLIREYWQTHFFPRQKLETKFEAFWEHALQDGYVQISAEPIQTRPFDLSAVRPIEPAANQQPGSFDLILYPKVGMLDGRHSYNPWLQELPDPVDKITWDNYACLSPSTAGKLDVRDGDVIRLDVPNVDGKPVGLELPTLIQPGQHDGIIAVPLGYGSKLSARFNKIGPTWIDMISSVGEDDLVGKNAAPLLMIIDGVLVYSRPAVHVTKTGKIHELASTQSYDLLTAPEPLRVEVTARPIIGEASLAEFRKNPSAGIERSHPEKEDLWPADHPLTGHHWGMAIDLTACTGCSACVMACQAENNISVVGKDEVRRKRSMHWIRIDRYYSGNGADVDVAHQPMLCQHCENAPCETVCPVLATVTNSEGINLQVYNRCVGTRYCANNCPYKVRRFNWFDYNREDRLQNLVLNPDVTVRARGVMEKCSFCIQRIQEAKIEAKRLNKEVQDGDIQTACQQTCPAQAIVFGDLNDPKSRVSLLAKGARSYRVLEELNTRSGIHYLTLVRNLAEGGEK